METKLFLVQWVNDDAKFLVRTEDEEKARDAFIDFCTKSGNIESMEDDVGGAEYVRENIIVDDLPEVQPGCVVKWDLNTD